MSALERASSKRRLVQRLTGRKDVPDSLADSTHVINKYIYQQRRILRSHVRHDSYFPQLRKDLEVTVTDNQAKKYTSAGRDLSDEVFDDDAVELNVDETFIGEKIAEGAKSRSQQLTKRMSISFDADLPLTTSPTKSGDSAENNEASHAEDLLSPDSMSDSEEMNGHYFLALDAYNGDPVPFEDICPIVIEFAAQQLNEFNWSKLKRRRCLEQCGNDHGTYRWSQDVKYDKYACWTCCMTKESVCMRWLGGNAFLILPLLPKLRKPGTGPEALEYWVWGGPT